MALINAVNINYVATGSLAINFQTDYIDSVKSISVTADDGNAILSFPEVDILESDFDGWYAIPLTTPLPFDATYTVSVIVTSFALDVNFQPQTETYTEILELHKPTYSRSRVVRQRLYEILSELEGDELSVYGTIHTPAMIANDIKHDSGVTVELGACYMTGSGWESSDEYLNEIEIPLNLYLAIDSPEDTQILTDVLESVWGYILKTDWRLSHFGISQRECKITAGRPQIEQNDRKLAKIEATLTIPVITYTGE